MSLKHLSTVGVLALVLAAGEAIGTSNSGTGSSNSGRGGVRSVRSTSPRPQTASATPSVRQSNTDGTGSTGSGGGTGTSGGGITPGTRDIEPGTDPYANLPLSCAIGATIRDFRAYHESGGHPDFERWTGDVRVGLVATRLGSDAKPVLASTTGSYVAEHYRDNQGRTINPALFLADAGDYEGQTVRSAEDRIWSAESFAQWYNDVPGVNASKAIELTLNRRPGTNVYVFDSDADAPYADRGGFFPINGELYGNYASNNKNFHFTTEVEAQFVYDASIPQVFTFSGDDDVWVFIDGRLAIDLGGVHARREQSVDVARMGLENGRVYTLKIFHAERRTTQSNFKMETTLQLRRVQPPQVSAMFD